MSPDVKTAIDAENSRALHVLSRTRAHAYNEKDKVSGNKVLHVDN